MREDLCFQLVSKITSPAAISSASVSARMRAPEFTESAPLDTGGTTRFLRNSLFFGTQEQLHHWSHDVTDRVFHEALAMRDLNTPTDQRQRSGFTSILKRFFREYDDRPVFVWVTPIWFLRTNRLPTEVRIEDRVDPLEICGTQRSHPGSLKLSCGRFHMLDVPLSELTFFYPTRERGRNPKLIRLRRTLKATLHGKPLYEDVQEEGFTLARPGSREDDFWLNKGKLPVEESLFTDQGGPRRLNCANVAFAKLHPARSPVDAAVELLTFTLTLDGLILDLKGSTLPFALFVEHYQGVGQTLETLT